MVTPLSESNTLDVPGLERLVEHVLAGGVSGLFLLGTTGEGPSLSYRLREELVARVAGQVAGRAPLLVGITDTAFPESMKMAAWAADHGAAAVVLAPPYYSPVGQPELMQYVERVATLSPLPVVLYNMPSHTKVHYDLETLRYAMELPNVVGLKDSSANMIYFHRVRRMLCERPDWSLLVGPEELLAESVLLGGHGGVCGGANLFPRLYVQTYEAAARGDVKEALRLNESIMDVVERFYSVGCEGATVIQGIKCALACLDICGDTMALPYRRFRNLEREMIRSHLRSIEVSPWVPQPNAPAPFHAPASAASHGAHHAVV